MQLKGDYLRMVKILANDEFVNQILIASKLIDTNSQTFVHQRHFVCAPKWVRSLLSLRVLDFGAHFGVGAFVFLDVQWMSWLKLCTI